MISIQKFIFVTLLAVSIEAAAVPTTDGRIAGGYEAPDDWFPYAAALYLWVPGQAHVNLCTGTLISTRYVLTAAHCAVIADNITVILGNKRLNESASTEVRLRVLKDDIIIPSRYEQGVYDWDLALLRLPQQVELSEGIQTIDLAEGDNTFAGDIAMVYGWGITYGAQQTIEQRLRWTENVIMSNYACTKDNPTYHTFVLDSHICQSTFAGRGACNGDNGSPLIVDYGNGTGEKVVVGIVSTGFTGCFHQFPVVFTRITSFRDWIRDKAHV